MPLDQGTDEPAFLSRLERLATVDSTQRVVRDWLSDGVPEVAIAVADEQTAGRGRLDRSWVAPPGAALLLSAGFRPHDLAAGHGWRLAAVVSLAMLDAAEEAAGLPDGRLALKWPNDIVAAGDDEPRKVAGVLGEAAMGADGLVATAVVGIGIDADWRRADFPPELASSMTSLRELGGDRPIDREQLLDAFLQRLEPRYEALRRGRFDVGGWSARQVTTGHQVEVVSGGSRLVGRASGVDPEQGSLRLVIDGREQSVDAGDVVRCRLIG